MKNSLFQYLYDAHIDEDCITAFIHRLDAGAISCKMTLEDFMADSDECNRYAEAQKFLSDSDADPKAKDVISRSCGMEWFGGALDLLDYLTQVSDLGFKPQISQITDCSLLCNKRFRRLLTPSQLHRFASEASRLLRQSVESPSGARM